ncbi:hypothetical protein V1477_010312, partial [Vespula maculifrons]
PKCTHVLVARQETERNDVHLANDDEQCRDDTLTDNPESLFLDIKHIARLCILDESEGVQVSTDDDSSCSILEASSGKRTDSVSNFRDLTRKVDGSFGLATRRTSFVSLEYKRCGCTALNTGTYKKDSTEGKNSILDFILVDDKKLSNAEM